ncbi:MAG: 1-phosphofructokinase family hexose kinase [Gordonia sp. (in: high G+C Gram-positive bacteria)]|uniref:1-phosphofructokinase family hexose kinase n=1 Tax=Gordonia sp. (in: high G+C Gram-positive bacteria) TaxID=84139 RepID=UPI003C71F17C
MIVTVTANPSIDRTVELSEPLSRGSVHRAHAVIDQPGGKGVNVARVVAAAGLDTLAVFPADGSDRFVSQVSAVELPHLAVPFGGAVRTNITIAEPDGTTTKINDAGHLMSLAGSNALKQAIIERAQSASWLVLSGSLPPGMPDDWYSSIIEAVAERGCLVAVDTSGAPLAAAAKARPGLLKPNGDELAELTGADGQAMEAAAGAGDPTVATEASRTLAEQTGGAILTTLGGAGALLTTPDGVWFATPPAVTVRSTVGAGDASLAGYVIADLRGGDPEARLRSAVAHGSAAASLRGTAPPTPDLLDEAGVTITRLH